MANTGGKLVEDVEQLQKTITSLQLKTSETVTELGTTVDLTTVPASFTILSDVQVYLATLQSEVEIRLDSIEAKVDEIIVALKAASLMK